MQHRDVVTRLQAAYAEHVGISGGSAGVSSVQLCCMAGRQRDEYYQASALSRFGLTKVMSTDGTGC